MHVGSFRAGVDRGRSWAAFALAAALAIAPVQAAADERASPWSDDHASRARLLDGGAEGASRLAGLEIDLDPGYHTYWRHAGDSGIPPAIDWSASSNVAAAELMFPAPARFADGAGSYIGYAGNVVLPLRVTPADPAAPVDLRLTLEYGVCKDICIPARAEIAFTLPAVSRSGHPAVAEAMARTPRPVAFGEAGPLGFLGVDVAGPDRLEVRVRAPQDAALFVEGPDHRWFLDPQAAMSAVVGDEGVFPVEIAERPRDPAGAVALRFTLVAGAGAVEGVYLLDPVELARAGGG